MSAKTKKTSFVSEKTTRERNIVDHLTIGQVICIDVPDSKTGEPKYRTGSIEAIGETPDKVSGEIRVWIKLSVADGYRTFYLDRFASHVYDETGLVVRVV